MILNSDSVQLIRLNSERLAQCVRSKDDLTDLATAANFEQVFSAIETLLTNTEMYFDDAFLAVLDESNWRSFKATLLVYTLNIVNRAQAYVRPQGQVHAQSQGRESENGRDYLGASAQA